MAPEIMLLATDLDGTLIGSANEFPLYGEFRDRMERLNSLYGTRWAACTGRTFRSCSEFIRPMRRMGILPDFVIVRHAFIFRLTPFGFLPHLAWNISTMIHLWYESRDARETLTSWHQSITGGALGVQTIRKSRRRLSLRFDSEESAAAAADVLHRDAANYAQLMVFTSGREVDVRCIPSTKGMAVAELARHLRLKADDVLAIGNGHNDISMLQPAVAAFTGCPSNSDIEVMETVHAAGGHIAKQRSLSGVMAIIDAYEEDSVCSELPPVQEAVQRGQRRSRRGSSTSKNARNMRRPKSSPWLFAGIAYAGLLAFAQFDVLPFSSIIRLPVDLLITGITRVLSVVF